MPTLRVATCFLCLFVSSFPLPAAAQTDGSGAESAGAAPASAASAPSAQDDDDAALVPAEPDFRVINLPTTMRLPKFRGNLVITHRFLGNFRRGSFADQAARLFGIDDGAVVGFEYRFGIARHVEAAVFRTASARTIQLYGKWDGIRQGGAVPVSASLVVSVEGADNFQDQYAPAVGISLSRRFGEWAAVYVVPTFVHNTAAILGTDENTTFVGVAARLRVRPTVYLAAEASPRVGGFAPGEAQYGFAIEKRAGGHMFQLNVTNGAATTFAQIARGGQPRNLGLGFNLSRKFF